MSEATSASNHTPAKESAEIKLGMPRSHPHTNVILIPQPALLALVRTRIVMLIIMDPTADLVNGGEFEYLRTGLLMLISITQQKGGTSPELISTQGELPPETEPASYRELLAEL
jgi:hypothetical protein